jgi:DnaJ-class molecular chaperone
MIDAWDGPSRAFKALIERLQLTDRQKEVLRRHRQGETLTSIAKSFGVSPPTTRKDFILGEGKELELRRTVKCPHCSGDLEIYKAETQVGDAP